ncbi:SCP2 sterol-binding domain-containing protein [Psychromarinibacter sp. C21-152]|uniref:SCP2 sterol-binding domain-containing protein n=1 Tax=Psychromarinibacter sediminicola TaxID=3033385 RepID=A0AAE3NM35_9RHOB|nr:SCP2 sterol-binding domain-containing protein [Psychromarinibacter sediminicola]MDF0600378.1 SCP2 sterol-binding domain-containing protein [Psychromarinibacter sediminicola]
MSDVINGAVAALSEKDTSEFDGRAKFVIENEGSIMLDSAGVRAADEEADVTLTSDAETFRAILEGDLDPTSAFMTGKLSVDGDMGMAMQLGAVLN